MPNTYTLIASNTLSSSAASVTFSSIPGTYTDLVLKVSARDSADTPVSALSIRFNSDTATNYSLTRLDGDGSAASSGRTSNSTAIGQALIEPSTYTANTFGSFELYIPSYTASQNKPSGFFGVSETNATAAEIRAAAFLWRNTAAISTIAMTAPNNFVSGSSFFLYGIKNS
jgi:hypothetical protein